MHLLYLTFGKKFTVHLQAAFSVYSFLAHPASLGSITVLTDAPEYYTHLQHHIRVQGLDKAMLEAWEGPHRFFWRVKIKAIQELCAQHRGEPVLYLDGDTFCYGNAAGLASTLLQGKALMHENEGVLSQAATKTEKKMWQQVKNKSYVDFALPPDSAMWNAGVVGVPNTKAGEEMAFALAACDQMCAEGVTRRLVEQFSLSVALERYYGLEAATPYIAHYWSNKEAWDARISQFFTEAFFHSATPKDVIGQMQQFDFTGIPVKRKRKNTALRLHGLVDRWFPDKEVGYLGR